MARKLTDNQIVQARKMRDGGMTNQAIGDILDVSHQTIRCAVDPQAREHHRLSCIRYHKNHKKENHLYKENRKEKIRVRGAKYRRDHRVQRAVYQAVYRRDHQSERTAYNAAREALILGATIGNLAEIKEIYRRAKEDARIRCYLCGKLIPIGHRHVDHIIPLSRGGAHRPSNLAVACDECNLNKGRKTPEDLGLLL